jgi:hypothetical protein
MLECGLDWRMWASKTLYADIKRTRENDDYNRSPRREEVCREMFHGERFFTERDSSRREILRGESLYGDRGFVERLSPWRESLRGETSPWREVLRGERLQGETLSMERTAKEREAS